MEEEEYEEKEENQIIGRKVSKDAREVGIIEHIQCINFMCHKNLSIKLGSHINFIIGRNGSNKKLK